MRNFKVIHLLIIVVSLTLTACGGGGSGGGANNGNENTAEASPPEQSAKVDPISILSADEKSEPVNMSNVDMTSLSDENVEDDETMNAMVSSITGTGKP